MNLKLVLAILLSLNLQNVFASDDIQIRTVISEGVGIDPQSAAQNAAQNALTNVVGSFMDTTTLLEKKSVITDGIKSETKNISKDIKDYSQGSIKSFEIVEIKQEAGLTKLTAKVSVRNENFSAYIKKLAEGEVTVGSELFAQVATEVKQKENLIDILKNNIILSIFSGEVQEFTVGKPMLLSQAIKDNTPIILNEIEGSLPVSDPNAIIFKVKTNLKTTFIDNLEKTLNSIKEITSTENCKFSGVEPYCLISADSWKNYTNREYKLDGNINYFTFKNVLDKIRANCCKYTKLKISIMNNQNSVIMSKLVLPDRSMNSTLKYQSPNYDDGTRLFSEIHGDVNPWILLKDGAGHNEYFPSLLLKENNFYIVLSIPLDIMKKAEKIVVSIEK